MTYTTLFQRWFGVVWRRDVMTSYQPKNVEPMLKCLLGIFYKRQNWYKKYECWFAALISMERFRMFKDFFTDLFSIKAFIIELETILILSTRPIFTKLKCFWKFNKNEVSATLFLILFTSAVICQLKLLHGSEIVQYLQNFKCYNVDEDHSRKHL